MALTAFGIDSGIELVSVVVVLMHLRALVAGGEHDEWKERQALRIIAVCFYVLAVYVFIDVTLSIVFAVHPATSPAGVAISAVALIVMPTLAAAKRRVAVRLDTSGLIGPAILLRADAAETALCAVLSATTLLGARCRSL